MQRRIDSLFSHNFLEGYISVQNSELNSGYAGYKTRKKQHRAIRILTQNIWTRTFGNGNKLVSYP